MTISKKRKLLFFDVLHYVPEISKIIQNAKAYYDKNLSPNKSALKAARWSLIALTHKK